MMVESSRVPTTVALFVALAGFLGSGCSRAADAPSKAEIMALSAAPPPASSCTHAVCADNFFVDATADDCVVGSTCNVTLKLVATGDFHINDEYPYRFRADDAAGVAFLGTDAAGKNTFSKSAGDWQKSEEKAGLMNVKFTAADRGTKTIGGLLKLSVCSLQACLLEQRPVTASVLAK
jgi:hypothetical protein